MVALPLCRAKTLFGIVWTLPNKVLMERITHPLIPSQEGSSPIPPLKKGDQGGFKNAIFVMSKYRKKGKLFSYESLGNFRNAI